MFPAISRAPGLQGNILPMNAPSILVRALTSLSFLAVTAPQAASALPGGTIEATVQLPAGDGEFFTPDEETRRRFFNQAHCQCSVAAAAPEPGTDPGYFAIKYELDGINPADIAGWDAQIWVGDSCDSREIRDRGECELIDSLNDLSVLRSYPDNVRPIEVDRFMFPTEGSCRDASETNTVYLLIDENGDTSEFETAVVTALDFDTEPPPLPQNLSMVPAENAVKLSWDTPLGGETDIYYYQVLCATAGGAPVFETPPVTPRYQTADMLCPDEAAAGRTVGQPRAHQPRALDMHDAGPEVPDAGPDASPDGPDAGSGTPLAFQGLPTEYLCAETSGTSNSLRVGGLQNGEDYQFMLLVVDKAQNVSYYDLGSETPAAVIDFWEHYQSQGGGAEGGVCLATSTYGDSGGATRALRDFRDHSLARFAAGRALIGAYYEYVAPLGVYADRSPAVRAVSAVVLAPFVAAAALWEYTGAVFKLALVLLALAWRVRRRRGAGTQRPRRAHSRPLRLAAAAALVLAAWAAPAAAQGYDPYFEEFKPVESHMPLAPSRWNFGVKLGPYIPAVDSEFDLAEGQTGPYETMFGGSALMGLIEIDRYFMWPAGQLGATASVGWMSKSGNAYATEPCPDPDAPECVNGVRIAVDDSGNPITSEGDTTAFRLIPMSLGVVYRFTGLDDRMNIPLVPYGKAGLSYYLWWVTQPSGDLAEAPTPMCPDPGDPGCKGNRARGASLGWQLSLGLALRAEAIDKQSAQSLRNEFGIEHAGFYGELTYAQVDGFGSDSRLHVGDLTWFAGLNFEF